MTQVNTSLPETQSTVEGIKPCEEEESCPALPVRLPAVSCALRAVGLSGQTQTGELSYTTKVDAVLRDRLD